MVRLRACDTIIPLLLLLNAEGVIPCDPGLYGDACDQLCPSHCAMLPDSTVRRCGIRTGKCYDKCDPGWYGDHCNETCSSNCIGNTCPQSTGHCTLGCKEIYIGDFCTDETMYKHRRYSWIGAVLTILVTLVTVVVGVMRLQKSWIQQHVRRRRLRYRNLKTILDWIKFEENQQEDRIFDVETHIGMGRPTQESDNVVDSRIETAPSDSIEMQPLIPMAIKKSDQHSSLDNTVYIRATHEPDLPATPSPAHRNPKEESQLFEASYRGDLEAVKCILAGGLADVNCRDSDGRTPMMLAAQHGHRGVVEFLVSEGADVTLVDGVTNNILHLACVVGDVKLVRFILSQGMMNINSRGEQKRTAVMVAALCGHGEVVKFLVSEGADVSMVDCVGNNILHLACATGHVRMVKFIILQDMTNINISGEQSLTPVMVAALCGHRDVVELLVSERADVSLVNGVNNNILHLACARGHVRMVKFILSQHLTDINSRGEWNRTPVMVAALCGHGEVVELLVSEGADVSLVDGVGNNILHLACAGGHVRTVQSILSWDMMTINSRGEWKRTPVMVAALCGHRNVVELLVSARADVSLVDDDGDNILHFACVGGDLNTVKFILSHNMANINRRGWLGAPVMLAAQKGHTEIVKYLVSEATDLSLVDDDGDNILHWACAGGDIKTVKFILSQNMADINSRGWWGTPVMLAAQNGHRQIVKFLVSKGADVS